MILKHSFFFIVGFAFFTLHLYAKTILVLQDEWGGINGMSLPLNAEPIETQIIRPSLSVPIIGIVDFELMPNGGCQLFGDGSLYPVGKARLFAGALQKDRASALALLPNGNGGWIASKNYIKAVGYPHNIAQPPFKHKIRDLEYSTSQSSLFVLLQNGEIDICSSRDFRQISVLELSQEEAVDFELRGNDIYVLTDAGQVYILKNYLSDNITVQFMDEEFPDDHPEYTDLELLPRSGVLLLDSSGLIHSYEGAPVIPQQPVSAIDMEILEAEEFPLWFPPGWNTSVVLQPDVIKLDPLGPEKTVTLWIQNAENLSSFSTEIHYDSSLINIEQQITLGRWWQQNMSFRNLSSHINPERDGVIYIRSTGFVSNYQGASGSGELINISISAVDDVKSGTTLLQIEDFTFQNALPIYPMISAEIGDDPEVIIAPSQPKISFAWVQDTIPVTEQTIPFSPGGVVQADILVQDGSRIKSCNLVVSFSLEHLRYLGMSKGNVWRLNQPVYTDFPLPSSIKDQGILAPIAIRVEKTGSCRDEPGSLLSVFFQHKASPVSNQPGWVEISSIEFIDYNGEHFTAETGNMKLYLQ